MIPIFITALVILALVGVVCVLRVDKQEPMMTRWQRNALMREREAGNPNLRSRS